MSRGLTAAVANALAAENVTVVDLVQLDLDSGTLRLTTAAYSLTYNGYTWTGAGAMGGIEPIQEGAEQKMYGIRLSLSGIDTSVFAAAQSENVRGRSCRLWYAVMDANHQIIADPVGPFFYRMDTLDTELGESAIVTCTAESRMVDWERPRVRRYNDADQRAEYPDDLAFQYTETLIEKEILWGRV